MIVASRSGHRPAGPATPGSADRRSTTPPQPRAACRRSRRGSSSVPAFHRRSAGRRCGGRVDAVVPQSASRHRPSTVIAVKTKWRWASDRAASGDGPNCRAARPRPRRRLPRVMGSALCDWVRAAGLPHSMLVTACHMAGSRVKLRSSRRGPGEWLVADALCVLTLAGRSSSGSRAAARRERLHVGVRIDRFVW